MCNIFEDRFDFTENKSSMYKNYFHLFFNIFFNLFKNSTKKERTFENRYFTENKSLKCKNYFHLFLNIFPNLFKNSKIDIYFTENKSRIKIPFTYILKSFLIYSKVQKITESKKTILFSSSSSVIMNQSHGQYSHLVDQHFPSILNPD